MKAKFSYQHHYLIVKSVKNLWYRWISFENEKKYGIISDLDYIQAVISFHGANKRAIVFSRVCNLVGEKKKTYFKCCFVCVCADFFFVSCIKCDDAVKIHNSLWFCPKNPNSSNFLLCFIRAREREILYCSLLPFFCLQHKWNERNVERTAILVGLSNFMHKCESLFAIHFVRSEII